MLTNDESRQLARSPLRTTRRFSLRDTLFVLAVVLAAVLGALGIGLLVVLFLPQWELPIALAFLLVEVVFAVRAGRALAANHFPGIARACRAVAVILGCTFSASVLMVAFVASAFSLDEHVAELVGAVPALALITIFDRYHRAWRRHLNGVLRDLQAEIADSEREPGSPDMHPPR